MLLRPRPHRRHLETADEQRVRTLLAGHGDQDSLGHFATRRDKAVLFSPSGQAALTYSSELVDPVERRRRLTGQSMLAAGGDVEAMELDEDFLRALEYAMPPSVGWAWAWTGC